MYESPIHVIEKDIQLQMEENICKAVKEVGINVNKEELINALKYDREQYTKGFEDGRAEAFNEIARAMYHQCFECDNDENMQKWDSGSWIRYKLFESVLEKLKEQSK